jgi:hypothetical protein
VFQRHFLIVPVLAATVMLALAVHAATAQSASGEITGRVLWGPCIRAIPLPAQPMSPDAQNQPQMPQPVPQPTNGLPAGAVLVAVQNTSISARTDETGRFTLSGVPAGQYLTIAAGPVADAASAVAERPNVFVNGGQNLDVGTMNLGGGPTPLGIACRFIPGIGAATGGVAPAPDATTPDTITPEPAPPDTSSP